MKRIILIVCVATVAISAFAQPARRRIQQQGSRSNANTITTRAQISFPTSAPMEEDVVWRRDIYRELNLMEDANAGLYYPTEPIGSQMNLFCYIFKLMMMGPRNGGISAYEYRMDGNEVFTDSARIKPLQFLDNYHIYYERTDRGIRLDNSDIPSAEVKGYYLKESAYYDQGTSTFHRKVIALCPIMYRADDFGDGEVKYPLFWVKYDDLAPFLSKQTIMTSNLNNAATMSVEDYFTMNCYKGKIYKTTNMLGRTLAQYCTTDSAMTKEQKKIESELKEFEENIFGNTQKRDSLDSISAAKGNTKTVKARSRRTRRSAETIVTRSSRRSNSSGGTSNGAARVSVRRQRH
ncbi:type IX secretion system ring subunit PorN/GldN [Prevotella nigrescens]|uniref:type IX secretion system ring protein PorN/GldN n=1 Tax=Prevotella nigrescens TaxID=28133 RepID=UPI0002182ECC|nr:gliding motility protein GldN [Prevotella nigrescens]EGQ15076.1 gliding motility protein GldN [Prevotella nigrescens ATCC 33563]UAK28341.1 gliding motility protein GldN [Prevotella nigrescens]WMS22560.1 gliding motility protein GldN [Prevotella nigrescens]SUB93005.1 gliding motility associated protein GldN [Prevotella nigrescens]